MTGRLAPSPTGAQHIGNARTYLLAWLWARANGGRVVLRMEDVDSPRVKPEAADQAVFDLRWLGLDWDEGPDVGGPHAPYVQSQRMALYADLLNELKQRELVYPCSCTRKDVRLAASAPHAEDAEPLYPGTCSHRAASDAKSLDRPYAWRFRTTEEEFAFDDAVAGPQRSSLREHGGDFVVWKGDGDPAYQLAVVADDAAMGIDSVLRGDDLIPSTFRQLALYAAFGWTPPRFAHVPLVVGEDGRRLAKRHGDTRLASLRDAGVAAEALIGLLAGRSGLATTDATITAEEILADFSLSRVSHESLVVEREFLARLGYSA